MALAVAKSFLTDLGLLPRSTQSQVTELVADLRQDPDAGLQFEAYGDSPEPTMRGIRIDQFWRALTVQPHTGEDRLLLRVLPRDDAARWARRAHCRLHPITGAFELIDHDSIGDLASRDTPTGESPLFSHLHPGELDEIGIDSEVQSRLAAISCESTLATVCALLPQDQSDALRLLAGGALVEEVRAVLATRRAADDATGTRGSPGPLHHPSSRASFWTLDDAENLAEALAAPLDTWRIFLHPDQRELAEAGRFEVPVRVTGAAGTGKTVVALHRARHLARRLPTGGKILLTCSSQPVAHALESGLVDLERLDQRDEDLRSKVVVTTVDRLANQVCQRAEGQAVRALSTAAEGRLWREVVSPEAGIHEASRLRDEWERVVLGGDIQTLEDYLAHGTLAEDAPSEKARRAARSAAWAVFENAIAILAEQGLRHRFEIARDAALHLDASATDRQYQHVVVDEAQDLHATHWRLLRSAVPYGADDLFIVGDLDQRIYDHRSDLGRIGIDMRGRTHHLDLNYRTSREIMHCANQLLTGERDPAPQSRSAFSGPEPHIRGYNDPDREIAELVAAIEGWIAEGVDVEAIGVTARTGELFGQLASALSIAAVPALVHRPGSASSGGNHVTIGTMHELKGLEFTHMAIIDFGDERVPLPWVISSSSVDPIRHRHDLQRERNLAYVACTRARELLRISWTGEPSRFLPPTP